MSERKDEAVIWLFRTGSGPLTRKFVDVHTLQALLLVPLFSKTLVYII